MEIVEHDVLDAVTGTDTGTPEKKPELELKQPEFSQEEMDILHELADSFTTFVADGNPQEAKVTWDSLDNDQKLVLWGLLDSKTRSTFKKHQKGN
jgi:soluble cytochrome b562